MGVEIIPIKIFDYPLSRQRFRYDQPFVCPCVALNEARIKST